jgi:hypothetical protein
MTSPFFYLSITGRDPLKPQPLALWVHPKTTFSAQVGAKQATLVRELFCATMPEGENPMPHVYELKFAHPQLKENLSEKMLAYAMNITPPESWSTQKQLLWLQERLSSPDYQGQGRPRWWL